MVGQPLKRFRITKIQQHLSQQPFRVIVEKPGFRGNPFRLEPKERLHALTVGNIGDASQAVRKPRFIDFPRARIGPASSTRIPAGVGPPAILADLFFQISLETHKLVLLGRFGHLLVKAAGVAQKHRFGQMPARPRHVMQLHPPTPNILRTNPIAPLPKLDDHARRMGHLTRVQLEVSQLLSRVEPKNSAAIAQEFRRPLSSPADGHNHPSVSPLHVVIRPGTVGGASAVWRKGPFAALFQNGFQGRIVGWR